MTVFFQLTQNELVKIRIISEFINPNFDFQAIHEPTISLIMLESRRKKS